MNFLGLFINLSFILLLRAISIDLYNTGKRDRIHSYKPLMCYLHKRHRIQNLLVAYQICKDHNPVL